MFEQIWFYRLYGSKGKFRCIPKCLDSLVILKPRTKALGSTYAPNCKGTKLHWYLPVCICRIVFLFCTCRSWCYNVSVRTTINPRHVPVLDLPNLKSICSLLDSPRTDREMAATVFDFYSDEPIQVPLKYRYYHMVRVSYRSKSWSKWP